MTPPLTERISLVLAECERQIKLAEKATAAPWSVPHFVNPETECNCGYVLCDHYMGAICTVHCDDGRTIEEGGGDDPVRPEAEANAKLIQSSRTFCPAAAVGIKTAIEAIQSAWPKNTDFEISALDRLTSPFAYLWA